MLEVFLWLLGCCLGLWGWYGVEYVCDYGVVVCVGEFGFGV